MYTTTVTYLTQAEFDALPDYTCSCPTFGPSWLEPGRYWRYRSRHKEGWTEDCMNPWQIGCWVEDGNDPKTGKPWVGTMYDWITIIPEPLLADEVVNLIKEIKERWENANDPGGSYGATLCQQILETPTIRKFEEMRRHSIHWFENTLNRVRNEFSSTFPPLPATR